MSRGSRDKCTLRPCDPTQSSRLPPCRCVKPREPRSQSAHPPSRPGAGRCRKKKTARHPMGRGAGASPPCEHDAPGTIRRDATRRDARASTDARLETPRRPQISLIRLAVRGIETMPRTCRIAVSVVDEHGRCDVARAARGRHAVIADTQTHFAPGSTEGADIAPVRQTEGGIDQGARRGPAQVALGRR